MFMPRWQPDARVRLQEAALALYDERGFDATTVEEIAERAGLTKRTFFRHFADKREVLFGGGENLEERFVTAVRSAPTSAGPLDAVSLGLEALAGVFDAQGEPAARLIRIVRASPELWERQLIKFASMAEVVARALRARGVGDPAAILAAESGITALRVASDRWIRDTRKRSLRDLIADALAELRALASLEPSPVAGTKKRVNAKGRKPRN
jgi:AcrR family transcriptional regulator